MSSYLEFLDQSKSVSTASRNIQDTYPTTSSNVVFPVEPIFGTRVSNRGDAWNYGYRERWEGITTPRYLKLSHDWYQYNEGYQTMEYFLAYGLIPQREWIKYEGKRSEGWVMNPAFDHEKGKQ